MKKWHVSLLLAACAVSAYAVNSSMLVYLEDAAGGILWSGDKLTVISGGKLELRDGAILDLPSGSVARADLIEDALKTYDLNTMSWFNFADASPLDNSATADQFNLALFGSVALGFASKIAVEGVNTTETPLMATTFRMPPEYVGAGDVQVVITAKVTNAAVTNTIDLAVYEMDYSSGALGSDICSTDAQTLTTSFADYTFSITATDLVAGDGIEIISQGVVEDGVGGTTTGIQISGIHLACDVKG